MLAAAALGSWAARLLAAHSLPPHGVQQNAFLTGMHMPIPVVQLASNWYVLLCVWLTVGVISFAGSKMSADLSDHPCAIWGVLVGYAAVAVCLTFFSIFQSIDLYYYALYAKLYGVYGVNPYALTSALQTNDRAILAALPLLHNPPFSDPYGPAFTLLAGILGRLEAHRTLWFSVWSWRVTAVLSCALSLLGVNRILRVLPVNERAGRLARFAFHPLVLYESGIGGHNDWLMVAPCVWAFAVVDGMPLIAGLLVGLAIAFKYVAIFALPFLVLRAARKGLGGAGLLACLALSVPYLCYRPFAERSLAVTSIAKVLSSMSMSLSGQLALPFFHAGKAQAPISAILPPIPYFGMVTWPRLIQLVFAAGFAAVLIASILRYRRRQSYAHVFATTTALLWALPALHAWYLTWLVPAVASTGRWATYGWWFAALSLLAYAPEGVQATPLNSALFAIIAVAMPIAPLGFALRQTAGPRCAGERRRLADTLRKTAERTA